LVRPSPFLSSTTQLTQQQKKLVCKKLFDSDSDSSLSDGKQNPSWRERTPRSASCNFKKVKKFNLSSDEDEESLYSRANTSICAEITPRSKKYRTGNALDHNHSLNDRGKSDSGTVSSPWRSPRSSRTNLYLSDSDSYIDHSTDYFEEDPVYLNSNKTSESIHIESIDLLEARRFVCTSREGGGSSAAVSVEDRQRGLDHTARRDSTRLVRRLSIQSSLLA
jgi:hypothetical protein